MVAHGGGVNPKHWGVGADSPCFICDLVLRTNDCIFALAKKLTCIMTERGRFVPEQKNSIPHKSIAYLWLIIKIKRKTNSTPIL